MMRFLRDKRFMKFVTLVVAAAFVGGGGFIMWGVGTGSLEEDRRNLVAKVGETRIPHEAFDRYYQNALQSRHQARGEYPGEEESRSLRKEILEELIREAVLLETAREMGLVVRDEEVLDSLQRFPPFQGTDGRFEKQRYLQVLQAYGHTPASFEADQRRQIELQKVQTFLADAVLYGDSDLDRYRELLSRELKAVKVELDPDDYEREVKPSEEDLRDHYEARRDRYDRPERGKLAHLLLSLPENADAAAKDQVRAVLEDYRTRIQAGKDTFEDLAKKYSQDPNTKDQGGDLGWIERDSLGFPFRDLENAAFSLKKGEVSGPVQTHLGYHLVKLIDHEKGYRSEFQEVRSKVLSDLKRERASSRIQQASEGLERVLERTGNLETAAKELGLPFERTSWFKGGSPIPGLKDSGAVSETLAGLRVKEWRGPLSVGETLAYFQVVEEREAARVPDPGKDQDTTALKLFEARQRRLLEDWIEDRRKKMDVKIFVDEQA